MGREATPSGRWSTAPYTRAEIIADLRRWSEAHGGRIPRAEDLRGKNRTPGFVSDGPVMRLFGSMADAIDAAFGPGTADRTRQKGSRRAELFAEHAPEMVAAPARPREIPTAAAIAPLPVEWLWRRRIPRAMLSLAAGLPGTRKSLLGLLIAADVSRREPVVVCAAEDDHERAVVPRLIAAGAELGNVSLWPDWGPDFDADELEDHARSVGAALAVVDPLTAFVPAGRVGMMRLAGIAHRTGCGVFALHHVTKNGRSAIERVAGPTGGAAGTARAVYAFGPEPDAPMTTRCLATIKTNIGPEPNNLVLAMEYERVRGVGEIPLLRATQIRSGATADEILDGPAKLTSETGGPVMAAVAEWLTNYLTAGPAKARNVIEDAARVGISERSLHAAAKALGVNADQRTLRLPPNHPLAPPTAPEEVTA